MARRTTMVPLIAAMLAAAGVVPAGAQTPANDPAAIEAEIKVKELKLKLLQAEQALKAAELKALEQSQQLTAAERLIARQGDAEKLLDLQAATALSGAQTTSDLQLAAQLKTAFGNAPTIGKEGAITIADGSTSQLLVTRAGSAKAALAIASQICKDLKDAGVAGAFIAPAGFDEKVVRTRLFKAEVDSLSRYSAGPGQELEGVQLESAAAVVGGLQVARYLIGGVQELAKTLQADYSLAVSANASRAILIEKSIAAQCPTVVSNTDLETSLRLAMDSSALSASLSSLISFVDLYDGKLAALTTQLADARGELAREQAKPKDERDQGKINEAHRKVKGFVPFVRQLQLIEPAVKRVKTFLDSLKTRDAQVAEALIWAGFETKWINQPRLHLTVSAQDVQVTKTSAWTGQKIFASSHVEALYHVLNKDGAVVVSGARAMSTTAPEIEVGQASADRPAGCTVRSGKGCPP